MATSCVLSFFAAPAAAPPSMIAMRLPTGLLLGSAASESACTTRIVSGSRSSISPTTVETSVSCPWPDELEVPIAAIMAPVRSILTWQPSIQVVVSFLGLSSGSKAELPPLGSRQQDNADAGEPARCARGVAPLHQRLVIGRGQRLVEHGMVVAAVIGAAARDRVGEFFAGG